MKTILITDFNLNKYKYHKSDEEVDVFIDEGLRDNLWGNIEDLTFDISDYDSEYESPGVVIISDDPPGDLPGTPRSNILWVHKTKGNLYRWKDETHKWLSVDRAAFTPKEDLHSDATLDLGKK